MDETAARRWRLVLGKAADELGSLNAGDAALDMALGYLYDRDAEGGGGSSGPGATDGSGLMTPTDWINDIHQLFPRSVADKLTDDALNRYGITEIVTSEEALDRVVPSIGLMKAILNTKHLMDPGVLAKARLIVGDVVRQLMESLAKPVRNPFVGPKDRRRRSRHKVAVNFDAKATVRANLRHRDPETGEIVIATPIFNSRVRLNQERWQVIVCLDQSGSMVDSVIHGAVTASIFHGIGSLKAHLVAFDTEVVDLTAEVGDPVEVLMKVQLGGGTDIGRALSYCQTLVESPARCIVVLISDFYEGGSEHQMLSTVSALVTSGVTVLCLGALTSSGQANYSVEMGERLVQRGAHVAVMTPDRLAEWVAEVMG